MPDVSRTVSCRVHCGSNGGSYYPPVSQVLTLLLSHQEAAALESVLALWKRVTRRGNLLLAYGGSAENFTRITHEPKLFVEDPRLRTSDHQREYQSYTAVVRQAAGWIQRRSDFGYVHFVEFDQVPLVADLSERMVAEIETQDADLLAHHLRRVDGTSHPHYLYHARYREFHRWLENVSVRANKTLVLSMMGTGSFWKRASFMAVAACEEPHPIYFELYLPTLAHHLGFRVRPWEAQSAFISNVPMTNLTLEHARESGAWTVHPVKDLSQLNHTVVVR